MTELNKDCYSTWIECVFSVELGINSSIAHAWDKS